MRALLVLCVLAQPVHADVTVVAVGDDPVATGVLQHALEIGLGARFAIAPAERVTARLAIPHAAAPAPDTQAAEHALDAAKEAFYRSAFAVAIDQLATAERALADAPARELRVRVQLWRVAVLVATRRDAEARAAAETALLVDPHLRVDLAVFWPSLAKLVDDLRARRRTVHVTIIDTPGDAMIRVDGIALDRELELPPGTHRFRVAAPGRRAVEIEQAISIDTRLSIPLAFAVDSALLAALRSGTAGDPRITVLAGVYDGTLRARVATATSPVFPLGDRAGLLDWIGGALSPPASRRRFELAATASVAGAVHTHSIASDVADLSLVTSGVLLELAASARREVAAHWSLFGALGGRAMLLASGDLGGRGVALPANARTAGGNYVGAALGGGVQLRLGPIAAALSLVARLDRVGSHDPDDRDVFDPATALSIGPRAELGAHWQRWYAGVGYEQSVIQVPIAGTDPTGTTVISGELGAALLDRWRLGLAIEIQNIDLQGGTPTDPELANATRSERTLVIGLRLGLQL